MDGQKDSWWIDDTSRSSQSTIEQRHHVFHVIITTTSFKPELNALLDALLFCFTVLVNEPTPGMRMQHLRFVDGTTPAGRGDAAASAARGTLPRLGQRLLLGFLCIGGVYSRGLGHSRIARSGAVYLI